MDSNDLWSCKLTRIYFYKFKIVFIKLNRYVENLQN